MLKTFDERKYRGSVSPAGLVSFGVREKETDLLISARRDLRDAALSSAKRARKILEDYASAHPEFLRSLEPVSAAPGAPPLVREMCACALASGVGPMAAVAGAAAEYVGRELMELSEEVIVENGGDIFMASTRKRLVGIYAGDSVLSGKLALEIPPGGAPVGVCSSSGTVGHSLNFGSADAAVVLSGSAALADAAATACSNRVKDESSIEDAIDFARGIKGVDGVIVVVNGAFGAWGAVKIRER
jgi:uncharacterized protein